MSSEEKNCEQQSTLFSCSLHSRSCILMPVSEKPGNIKLSSSEPSCFCIKAVTECQKLCETCAINFTSPKPISFSVELCECEDETSPSPTASEEERTHQHTSCDTPVCVHNSQGVQPIDEGSDPCPVCCTGACSSQSPVISKKPVYIDPRLKDHTPKSIAELKASITGLTGLEKSPIGNLLGCEYVEFRCQIQSSGSVCEPKDSQTSEPSSSNRPPVKQGISLTMEPNDHRYCTKPDDCKHSRESSKPPAPHNPASSSPPAPRLPEEPPCLPEEPPCLPEEPPCLPEEPPCLPEEPPCLPEEPPCLPEEPPCLPEEPPCLPEEPPCPTSPSDSANCVKSASERQNNPPC